MQLVWSSSSPAYQVSLTKNTVHPGSALACGDKLIYRVGGRCGNCGASLKHSNFEAHSTHSTREAVSIGISQSPVTSSLTRVARERFPRRQATIASGRSGYSGNQAATLASSAVVAQGGKDMELAGIPRENFPPIVGNDSKTLRKLSLLEARMLGAGSESRDGSLPPNDSSRGSENNSNSM